MWKRSVQLHILELLGEGGQGCVYKALRRDRHAQLEQTVAVKILHSRTTVDLWRLEFESLSQVRSRYCVQVLSFERYKGKPALILEYVDGLSLAQIAPFMTLSQQEIHELMAQLEEALRDLHTQSLVHGDLSPQNIMVDRTGRIRLLDFGLANCSRAELRVTPRFAAPERLRGSPATPASDLFALGRVFEFLSAEGLPGPQEYLHEDPSHRCFRRLSTCEVAREQLAATVARVLKIRSQASECVTLNLPLTQSRPTSPYGRLSLSAILSFLVLATSTASHSSRPMRMSVLEIRTHNWHYLILNGKPLGYAPVLVPLETGEEYKLEWISSDRRGTLHLRPQSSRQLRLTDSDFSH